MSVDLVTTLHEVRLTEQALHRIFAVTPHPYLVLAPSFVIVGANDAYLKQTLTNRSDIVGCHMFEIFPDNPNVPESQGVRLLHDSLRAVLDLRLPHRMAQQRYDVRGGDGRFVERHWKPVNYPVLDGQKRVSYLLHHVENVTDAVLIFKKQQQICPTDYLEKARRCGQQAAASRSHEQRRIWMEMQEQYLKLASGHFEVGPGLVSSG